MLLDERGGHGAADRSKGATGQFHAQPLLMHPPRSAAFLSPGRCGIRDPIRSKSRAIESRWKQELGLRPKVLSEGEEAPSAGTARSRKPARAEARRASVLRRGEIGELSADTFCKPPANRGGCITQVENGAPGRMKLLMQHAKVWIPPHREADVRPATTRRRMLRATDAFQIEPRTVVTRPVGPTAASRMRQEVRSARVHGRPEASPYAVKMVSFPRRRAPYSCYRPFFIVF